MILGFKWNTLIYSLYNKQLDVDEELIKSELNKQIKKKRGPKSITCQRLC